MNECVSYELKLPALLYHRYSAEEDFAFPEACGQGGVNIQLEKMFLEYILQCN